MDNTQTTAESLLRRALDALDSEHPDIQLRTALEIRTYLYTPSDDAEEPVAWGHPNTAITGKNQPLMMVSLEIPSNAQYPQLWVPLYLHPPKPAEPEATIAKLQAENFALASGLCTEGGPWGDEGGTPYCKYAEPAARKPIDHQDVLDKAVSLKCRTPELMAAFMNGVKFAEKHYGIGGQR